MKVQIPVIMKGFGLMIIVLLLFQCNDDDIITTENDNCIIQELITSPYLVIDDSIAYISSDTFTHIIENGFVIERLKDNGVYEEFTYNGDGLLATTRSYSQGAWYVRDSFFYEGQNLINRKGYSREGILSREEDFYWDNGKLKSGFLIYSLKVNGETIWNENRFNFKYENGNIVETEVTFYEDNGDSLVTIREFQFDSHENFRKHLTFVPLSLIIDFSLWGVPYWFSTNNVTLETRRNVVGAWTGEVSYSFTWDNEKVSEFVLTTHSHINTDPFVRPVKLYYDCW